MNEAAGESPLVFEGRKGALDEENFETILIEAEDDTIAGEGWSGVFVGEAHASLIKCKNNTLKFSDDCLACLVFSLRSGKCRYSPDGERDLASPAFESCRNGDGPGIRKGEVAESGDPAGGPRCGSGGGGYPDVLMERHEGLGRRRSCRGRE